MLENMVLGRESSIFQEDFKRYSNELKDAIRLKKVLVIGGAGTIGRSVVALLFRMNPRCLHVVDISENGLVEVVRSIRSSDGYAVENFKTFSIDAGGSEFEHLLRHYDSYDIIFNLSALKHVRTEKDPYSLMRMIQVNIFTTIGVSRIANAIGKSPDKYFCVSTDKAANPANIMGASKKIMELFLLRESENQKFSTARFANVAFSDGSLLDGFRHRFALRQPISAPSDVQRYFISREESGQLCVLSAALGGNREIYIPAGEEVMTPKSFSDIAVRFLEANGYEAEVCESEDEARTNVEKKIKNGIWPCYFFASDTTGEKSLEEFYTQEETPNFSKFESVGVIKYRKAQMGERLEEFEAAIHNLVKRGSYKKEDILELILETLPGFRHRETGKSLEGRM